VHQLRLQNPVILRVLAAKAFSNVHTNVHTLEVFYVMMQFAIGTYTISMKYLFKRSNRNTYYYRRRVPADLADQYPKPFIEISLKQNDKSVAAALYQEKHRLVEEQFKRLRQGLPKHNVLSNYQAAIALLAKYDLAEADAKASTQGAEEAKEAFYEDVDATIRARSSEQAYAAYRHNETPFPHHLLDDTQRSALAIAQGEFRLTASAYPAEYLRITGRINNRRNVNEANNVMNTFIAQCGDRAPADYSRSDINNFITASLKTKKSATVQRQLKSIAAMFNFVTLQLDIKVDKQHCFEKFFIPGLGDDLETRADFTDEQIRLIRDMPSSLTLELDCMIHLMLDTGLRVKECCGLLVSDINLEAETPHLVLYKNNIRGLKNKNSRRLVPLVGASLTALQKLIEAELSTYLFPRYVIETENKVKNGSASGACNKRLETLLGELCPTSHCFRHTMQTRLRNAECPKDKRNEISGWAKDVSDKYGSPSDLKLKAKYLLATL
jgi:integrase